MGARVYQGSSGSEVAECTIEEARFHSAFSSRYVMRLSRLERREKDGLGLGPSMADLVELLRLKEEGCCGSQKSSCTCGGIAGKGLKSFGLPSMLRYSDPAREGVLEGGWLLGLLGLMSSR